MGRIILAEYPYGSVNYGTTTPESDVDIICIVPDGSIPEPEYQETSQSKDITYYIETKWIDMIKEHNITALECIFLPNQNNNKNYLEYFDLDLNKLRESISSVCSNSWVKAKKKMTVEKDLDIYKGKKSLFHSIRIYDFGYQIAVYGKIEDYKSQIELWEEIYNDPSIDYKHYKNKYQKLFNWWRSNFVKVAPKK